MPRFGNETIRKYGEKIAQILQVVIKCDEFGQQWNRENKDCQMCKIDSHKYYTKCREFTLGVNTGRRPAKKTKKKLGRPRKLQVFKRKRAKCATHPFRKGTRLQVMYEFIKKRKECTIEDLMEEVSDTFDCDVTRDSIRLWMVYMRKTFREFGHEELRHIYGYYRIEKTRAGKNLETQKRNQEKKENEKNEEIDELHEEDCDNYGGQY